MFVYLENCSGEITYLPRGIGGEVIHPEVFDSNNLRVKPTEAGLWHDSQRPGGDFGFRVLPVGTVVFLHLDLTDIVGLQESGEYRAIPKVILMSGNGEHYGMPSEMVGGALGFKLSADRFTKPSNTPPTAIVSAYLDQLGKPRPGPQPLTEAEKEEMKTVWKRAEEIQAAEAAKVSTSRPAVLGAEGPQSTGDESTGLADAHSRVWGSFTLIWIAGGGGVLCLAYWLVRRSRR